VALPCEASGLEVTKVGSRIVLFSVQAPGSSCLSTAVLRVVRSEKAWASRRIRCVSCPQLL